jgi:hypothetical protein
MPSKATTKKPTAIYIDFVWEKNSVLHVVEVVFIHHTFLPVLSFRL